MKPRITTSLLLIVVLGSTLLWTTFAAEKERSAMEAQALEWMQEGLYSQAADLWRKMLREEKPVEGSPRQRELSFRAADAGWRALAGTAQRDRTVFNSFIEELTGLAETTPLDRWGAEAHQSLGDYYQAVRRQQWQARNHYQNALAFWADQEATEFAQARYADIIVGSLKPIALDPSQVDDVARHLGFMDYSQEELETARRLVTSEEDRRLLDAFLLVLEPRPLTAIMEPVAHAEFLSRSQEYLAPGEEAAYYDFFVLLTGDFLARQGRLEETSDGRYQALPDYVAALEVYDRIADVKDYEGRLPLFNVIKERAEEIRKPVLELEGPRIIRPGSLHQLTVTGRNLDTVEISAHPVDARRTFSRQQGWYFPEIALTPIPPDQVRPVVLDAPEPLFRRSEFLPSEPHTEVKKTFRDEMRTPGLYWIFAEGRTKKGETVAEGFYLSVTDATVMHQDIRHGGLVFLCEMDSGDALTGSASIHSLFRRSTNWFLESEPFDLSDQGLGTTVLPSGDRLHSTWDLFVLESEAGPALYLASRQRLRTPQPARPTRVYIYTDRPLYRPGETVRIRYINREDQANGEPPSVGDQFHIELRDSRGNIVERITLEADEFGSASFDYEIPAHAALGMYEVRYRAHEVDTSTGDFRHDLFRVEEYRTPEFRVTLELPRDEEGKPKAPALDERVEAEVLVEYYAGGPIPEATVEYVIQRTPLYHQSTRQRRYPWYYDQTETRSLRGRFAPRLTEVARGTVETDEEGRAKITFSADVPDFPHTSRLDWNGNWRFSIDLTVRDASRRTVKTRETLRAAATPYRWELDTPAQVYRPGDQVRARIESLDVYDRAVEATGTVRVSRSGDVEKVRVDPATGQTVVLEREEKWIPLVQEEFSTAADGAGWFTFAPDRAGLYKVEMTSTEDGRVIEGATEILAATRETHELTHRFGRLQLYTERDTYGVGETGRAVVLSPERGNTVLFTTYGADLLSAEVLKLEGNIRVIDLPLDDQAAPNFHLQAAMIRDREVQVAHAEWIVPPEALFLEVELEGLPDSLAPGDDVELGFRVVDQEGNPVEGAFSFGVTDRAIQALQPSLAMDIRQHFHGMKRPFHGSVETPSIRDPKFYRNIPLERADGRIKGAFTGAQPHREEFWRDAATGERLDVFAPGSRTEIEEILGQIYFEEISLPHVTYQAALQQIFEHPAVKTALPGVEFNISIMTRLPGTLDLHFQDQNLMQILREIERRLEGQLTIDWRDQTVRIEILDEEALLTRDHRVLRQLRSGVLRRERADGLELGRTQATPMAAASGDLAYGMVASEVMQPEDHGAEAVVRDDFSSAAYWNPSIVTDAAGRGRVAFQFPENLTEWEVLVRGITRGMEVGETTAFTQTSLPVSVRVQTPRFLVEGDEALLSGVVQNLTDDELTAGLDLRVDGLEAVEEEGFEERVLPVNRQVRIDRLFHARTPSDDVTVTGEVRSSEGSDAMEVNLPVVEYGIAQYHGGSLILRSNGDDARSGELGFELPPQKYPERAQLDIRLSASLASAALDALPYLAGFPYGCTEQTMSRFLPSIMVRRTLKDLDLEESMVEARLFGGMEKGDEKLSERNFGKLQQMIDAGLDRLYEMQKSDGSWGWWKHSPSNAWMTAYATYGLVAAGQAGESVETSAIRQAQHWLRMRLIEHEQRPDMAAWMLYPIAIDPGAVWDERAERSAEALWEKRGEMVSYGRSLLALSLWHRRDEDESYAERARALLGLLENGIREVREGSELLGEEPGEVVACHWGEEGPTIRWNRNGVESTAWALRAFLAIAPENVRAGQAMRWLVRQRRGAQWRSTRDSAIALMALTDFIRLREEQQTEMEVRVLVNGEEAGRHRFAGDKVLGIQTLAWPGEDLAEGANGVVFEVEGTGTLYASIGVDYFTREDPIPAAGNEVYVSREYRHETTVPRVAGGVLTRWTDLESEGRIQTGDIVEARLLIEVPVDLEYLVFEDKKPAGLEPVQQLSGEKMRAVRRRADGEFSGERHYTHMEIREQHTAFFIDRLPAGVYELRYQLRAETPGRFTVLPVLGHAMYVPEVRANSRSFRLEIAD